jgi:hypothetical protein
MKLLVSVSIMCSLLLVSCSGGSSGSGGTAGSTPSVPSADLVDSQFYLLPENTQMEMSSCLYSQILGSTSIRTFAFRQGNILRVEIDAFNDFNCQGPLLFTKRIERTVISFVKDSTDFSFDLLTLSFVKSDLMILDQSHLDQFNSGNYFGFSNWEIGTYKDITCLSNSVDYIVQESCAGAITPSMRMKVILNNDPKVLLLDGGIYEF